MIGLLRFWREGLIGLVLIFAALQWANARHWHKRFNNEQAAHAQTRADYKAFANGVREKSEAIIAKSKERNARITAEYRAIEKENDSEIRRRIDAAVAAVRLRTNSPGGSNTSRGRDAVSSPAEPPSGASGAGQTAVVPAADLEICAENTIKNEGWQSWWNSVSAIER